MVSSPSIKRPHSSKARSDGSRVSKSKIKSKSLPPKQQKTKPSSATQPKKKRRIYTEKELGIPKLNMITPVGVEKPRGKKKGKVFVDDQDASFRLHLRLLTGSFLGCKRRMEEIREARLKEAEARREEKKSKLEETKESIRKKRKRRKSDGHVYEAEGEDTSPTSRSSKHSAKRVSFA
ncbi:hypothetical protein GP486_000201 [Trichoglossum hirsutum]|uniref:60S ribosomal subunit assembly/export protein LOC1 n=1 Tax=Trichoglossum hirsutum TaxID=265104 RepID=A0A9P8RU81_9PEZI|nr:hypothetical protein GP486_000201 [Trichoglossum hirsutum]